MTLIQIVVTSASFDEPEVWVLEPTPRVVRAVAALAEHIGECGDGTIDVEEAARGGALRHRESEFLQSVANTMDSAGTRAAMQWLRAAEER